MAHPLHHAQSSARKFGGEPEDFQAVHDWFDFSKSHFGFMTHRALRHHSAGIYEAERVFGTAITTSCGREVPVRFIGEQHVREDCQGRVPTVADWLGRIAPEPWMGNGSLKGVEIIPPEADPAAAWREEAAAGRTILGLAEWLEMHGGAPHG